MKDGFNQNTVQAFQKDQIDLLIASNPTLATQYTRAQLVEAGNMLVYESLGVQQPTTQTNTPASSTPFAVTTTDINSLKTVMTDFIAITVKAKADGFSAPLTQALQYDQVNKILQSNPNLAQQYS